MRKKKSISIFCSILLFLSFATASLAKESETLDQSNALEQITVSKERNTIEVLIQLSRAAKNDYFQLSDPARLVVDFFETQNITAPRRINVNDIGIIAIRTGMFKPNIARIVFDFSEKPPHYKIESTQRGLRILFWVEGVAEVKPEEIVPEKIKEEVIEDAIARMRVAPEKANLNDPVLIDMGGSQNAQSMEVDVFNTEGDKIDTIPLTPASATSEVRFDTPGDYVFRGKAFNSAGKPSENPCETRVHVNYPPVCKLESLYYENYVGQPFTFDVSGSSDSDGEVVKVHFRLIDKSRNLLDSFTDTRKPFLWTKVFEKEGRYSLPVVVTDDSGAESDPVEAQIVVSSKRVFLMVDGGALIARGSPYGGYAMSRVGLVIKITPRTLDFILSGGGGQALISDPWKSILTANMLFNAHFGPAFLGVGAGIMTRVRDDRNPDGELIANFGFEAVGDRQTRRSVFFEVRGPIGKGRVFSDHHKLMIGVRFLF